MAYEMDEDLCLPPVQSVALQDSQRRIENGANNKRRQIINEKKGGPQSIKVTRVHYFCERKVTTTSAEGRESFECLVLVGCLEMQRGALEMSVAVAKV